MTKLGRVWVSKSVTRGRPRLVLVLPAGTPNRGATARRASRPVRVRDMARGAGREMGASANQDEGRPIG
jgi:hypothetical protein